MPRLIKDLPASTLFTDNDVFPFMHDPDGPGEDTQKATFLQLSEALVPVDPTAIAVAMAVALG